MDVEILVVIVNGEAQYFDGLSWQPYFDTGITDPNVLIDIVQLTDQLYWADPDEAGGISNWDGASVTVISGSPANASILEVITNRVAASGVEVYPGRRLFFRHPRREFLGSRQ